MVARERRSFHAGSDSQGNGLAGLSPKISFLGERIGIDLGKNDRATGRCLLMRTGGWTWICRSRLLQMEECGRYCRRMMAVQFGYIGLRLRESFGRIGLLLVAILGAVNIPFYEEMARKTHWWQYSGCRMLSFTPWFIIVGEFGIALALALLASTLRRGSWRTAAAAGVGAGLSIFVCYAVAFFLTDRLVR